MPISDELEGEAAALVPVDDPRWQVIERIVGSPCFQKSERLKAFLKYVAQQYLAGHSEKLTGHQIGKAVFGKHDSYDQSEDNTVRIHARQLRLRLLEYFDTFGRDEPFIVEIPKGSYIPLFRPAAQAGTDVVTAAPAAAITAAPESIPAADRTRRFQFLGWMVAAILCLAIIFLLNRKPATSNRMTAESAFELWPLSEMTARGSPAQVILCDNNFALLQVAARKHSTLSDYLKPDYPDNLYREIQSPHNLGVSDLLDQLRRKQLTSYADAATAGMIMHLTSGPLWSVRPARDVKPREIQDGNYVLLGSPWSDPWVELYEPRLNFLMTTSPPLGVVNRKPLPGENPIYFSQGPTGNMGDDYAAIAMMPNEKRGVVMIIQGTKEEGTEAAGLFITEPNGRKALRDKLGVTPADLGHTWFEALLRTKTYAGASAQTVIVSARRVTR